MLRLPMQKMLTRISIAGLLFGAAQFTTAATFAVRDLHGVYNGRLSYGALYRLQDQDTDLIAIASDGNSSPPIRTTATSTTTRAWSPVPFAPPVKWPLDGVALGLMPAVRHFMTLQIKATTRRALNSTVTRRNWWAQT